MSKQKEYLAQIIWQRPPESGLKVRIQFEGHLVTNHQQRPSWALAHFLFKQSDCLLFLIGSQLSLAIMAPTLNTLLTLVLLVSSPKTTLASPPASIGSLLCAGTLVFFCFFCFFLVVFWYPPLCRHPWVLRRHWSRHGTRLPCLWVEVQELDRDLEGGPGVWHLGEKEEGSWSWRGEVNLYKKGQNKRMCKWRKCVN